MHIIFVYNSIALTFVIDINRWFLFSFLAKQQITNDSYNYANTFEELWYNWKTVIVLNAFFAIAYFILFRSFFSLVIFVHFCRHYHHHIDSHKFISDLKFNFVLTKNWIHVTKICTVIIIFVFLFHVINLIKCII